MLREGAGAVGRGARARPWRTTMTAGTSTKGAAVAIAQETFEHLRTAGLAEIDPEIAELARTGARAAARPDRADRVGELHLAGGARGDRLDADEQVRRGLPGQALLRRLRGRRRDRGARARARARRCSAPSTRTSSRTRARRRTWPSTSPCSQPGDRVLGLSLDHGGHLTHGLKVNFSGKLYEFHHYGVSRETMTRRLRRGARAGEGGAAEADRLRRLRVPAHGRGRQVPRDRRRGRRAADDRHGALRRPRRRGPPPEPGAALALRHLDDAQDARRPARRLRPLHRGARRRRSTGRSSPACRAAR